MNLQSGNNAAIEPNSLTRIDSLGVDNEQAGEWNPPSEQALAKIELAAISSTNQSIGTLYFGSSYRATSPKTHELMIRHSAIFQNDGNNVKSEE